jgi:hypothetical protein
MSYHDRDWYRDEYKAKQGAKPTPTARAFDRVGPRPGRRVVVRAKFWQRLLPSGKTPAWKIALFWIAFAFGLTALFQPVVLERQAKRLMQPAMKLVCSVGVKCT